LQIMPHLWQLRSTVGGPLFLAACFELQIFKAQAWIHKTWSSGAE
jgi:hypothetical protein